MASIEIPIPQLLVFGNDLDAMLRAEVTRSQTLMTIALQNLAGLGIEGAEPRIFCRPDFAKLYGSNTIELKYYKPQKPLWSDMASNLDALAHMKGIGFTDFLAVDPHTALQPSTLKYEDLYQFAYDAVKKDPFTAGVLVRGRIANRKGPQDAGTGIGAYYFGRTTDSYLATKRRYGNTVHPALSGIKVRNKGDFEELQRVHDSN